MPGHEQRCRSCRRLLLKHDTGAVNGLIEIKCPRCRTFNTLRPHQSPDPKRPRPRRARDGKEPRRGPQTF
ncbi:Com family DNA-binding transcriptional regulator [Seohaeicola saemankumensis]|nr:Com family DNA-binding transcriptional regulator [Seohaeicola saemankumensis]